MKKQFEQYLIDNNYKQFTPSGNPSTVYDYIKRIDKDCEWEQCSWPELAGKIDSAVKSYDAGGAKEELGHKSHNAVICALRVFKSFVHSNF